ncbi:MAG: glycosyltransferase, partial [Candidatus Marinimicrobia bacterium]|nr:glycosyltransferase [Candidatus Neomarinimicrobiota bacterium]
RQKSNHPLLSVIVPVFNEEEILETNLNKLQDYLSALTESYSWEIIIVNDGSDDGTRDIADQFASMYPEGVTVIHHFHNSHLGEALKSGLEVSAGDYVVTLDIDLSYSLDHIEKLLHALKSNHADIAVASPYMKGGRVINVPWTRRIVSRAVNLYMGFFSQLQGHTFTSMVRAYRGEFIRSLNLKAYGYEVSPEILYKAFILRAKVVEIPATLKWSKKRQNSKSRKSLQRVIRGVLPGLMSGFMFRPYRFFLTIGTGLLFIAIYIVGWIFYHTFNQLQQIAIDPVATDRFSMAVAEVFSQRPYSFMVGGIVLIVALQFLSIGFLSLQNKRYFEEQFHLLTNLLKKH